MLPELIEFCWYEKYSNDYLDWDMRKIQTFNLIKDIIFECEKTKAGRK